MNHKDYRNAFFLLTRNRNFSEADKKKKTFTRFRDEFPEFEGRGLESVNI